MSRANVSWSFLVLVCANSEGNQIMGDGPGERHLLVDYENVRAIDAGALPDDLRVTIFVGHAQANVPFDLVQGTQPLGAKVEWLKVDGNGPNALDFHIAYYVGCLLTRCPQIECLVLSKDTGFDPLLRLLKKKGHCCRRIGSLAEMDGISSPEIDQNFVLALDSLKKLKSEGRPRRRKALTHHVATLGGRKMTKAEVARVVALLFAEGLVTEAAQQLTYNI
jgi:hypothetical protein